MHKIRILWYRGIKVLDSAAKPRTNATCDCRDFTHDQCIVVKSDCRFFDITWCITRIVLFLVHLYMCRQYQAKEHLNGLVDPIFKHVSSEFEHSRDYRQAFPFFVQYNYLFPKDFMGANLKVLRSFTELQAKKKKSKKSEDRELKDNFKAKWKHAKPKEQDHPRRYISFNYKWYNVCVGNCSAFTEALGAITRCLSPVLLSFKYKRKKKAREGEEDRRRGRELGTLFGHLNKKKKVIIILCWGNGKLHNNQRQKKKIGFGYKIKKSQKILKPKSKFTSHFHNMRGYHPASLLLHPQTCE